MKRLYFILALSVLSLASCYGQHTTADLKKTEVQRELLKEYFLCVCITEGFKDKQIAEDDTSQSVYFDILRYSPEAFQEVKNCTKKFVETIAPSPIVDLGNKRAVILSCIEKYKSKELGNFIKSMDKHPSADGQSLQATIVDGDVYIYEYALKKPDQAHIGFIIINNDLIVQDIYFTVNFSKEQVKNVCRRDKAITNTVQYSKREDGNILIDRNKFLCYDSENFISRQKLISDNIYKMIYPSFLKMTNKERLKMLNDLSK